MILSSVSLQNWSSDDQTVNFIKTLLIYPPVNTNKSQNTNYTWPLPGNFEDLPVHVRKLVYMEPFYIAAVVMI